MSKSLRLFFIIIFLGLPLWWGINVFAQKLEDFFYTNVAAQEEEVLNQNAAIEKQLESMKPSRKEETDALEVGARSAISVLIKKDGTEKVLFQKNIQEKLPIASITKLMTALLVMRNYNFEETVEISSEAAKVENEQGSGNLRVAEKFFVKDLLYFLLIESNNGAAFALADMMDEKEFVDLMNITAAELGLEDTFFVNPTGLDPENQQDLTNYSTVEDVAKLAIYILKTEPSIWDIARFSEFDVYSADGILFRKLKSTNELLGTMPDLSGKTGWTLRAGGCLAIIYLAPDKQSYLVNIVLSSEDRFGDMEKMMDWLNGAYQWQ